MLTESMSEPVTSPNDLKEFGFDYEMMFTIDSNDFDRFVKSKYPELKEYEFIIEQEGNNYSNYTFTVYPEGHKHSYMDKWDIEEWGKFIDSNGRRGRGNYLVFQKLGLDGYLLPGKYLVSVFW